MYENGKIKYKMEEEGIAVVRIENPPANTFGNETLEGLKEIFEILDQDEKVRVIILTGFGKFFGSGAELKEALQWTPESCYALTRKGEEIFYAIERTRVPVIAAVNGYALGGGLELALSCDIRVCSSKAKFGLPETSLGIVPGWGGTQRLMRVIGLGKAKELIFAADRIDAQEAYRLGLVEHVTEPEQTLEKSLEIARKISACGSLAVAKAKELMHYGRDASLSDGLRAEAAGQKELFRTEDHMEGITAFLEKRRPEWKNE